MSQFDFSDLRIFLFFFAQPRSGHTLISQCLNAHPNVVISNEANIVYKLEDYTSGSEILEDIVKQYPRINLRRGYEHGKYNYDIPNQDQLGPKKAFVVGDKDGVKAIRVLSRFRSNKRIAKWKSLINCRIKAIQVVRNPYDSIATITCRNRFTRQNRIVSGKVIDTYIALWNGCDFLVETCLNPEDTFVLRIEDFINSPHFWLYRLAQFLSLDPIVSWINNCASIVFPKPHISRNDAKWPKELIERVKGHIDEKWYLRGYTF